MLISLPALTKEIRIAVLDSGFTKGKYSDVKLCNEGHKDFTGTGLEDTVGHGSHIANVIADRLKDVDYCIIIIKFLTKPQTLMGSIYRSTAAFHHAILVKADYINYSAGGTLEDPDERSMIAAAIYRNIKVFVAAGNESANLDKNCEFYPACYKIPGLRVVGNVEKDGKRTKHSNYGKVVTDWENGVDIVADNGKYPKAMTGTSQSCAIALAKDIKK